MQAETNLYLNRGFLCLSVPKMYNANLILIILQNVQYKLNPDNTPKCTIQT